MTTITRATPQQVSDLIPGRFERRLMNVKQQCAFLEPNYIKKWEEIKIYGEFNELIKRGRLPGSSVKSLLKTI